MYPLHPMRCVLFTAHALVATLAGADSLQPERHDAPLALHFAVMAELRARDHLRQAGRAEGGALLIRPVLELTSLGRGGLIVYRAQNVAVSHSRPLLVGYDGERAIPLGGFQAPELVRAATVAGIRFGVSRERDRDEAILLARLADPNGGSVSVVDSILRFPGRAASAALPGSSSEGPGFCLAVRSMRPGWVNTQEVARYCFEADTAGQLLTWVREAVP